MSLVDPVFRNNLHETFDTMNRNKQMSCLPRPSLMKDPLYSSKNKFGNQ